MSKETKEDSLFPKMRKQLQARDEQKSGKSDSIKRADDYYEGKYGIVGKG